MDVVCALISDSENRIFVAQRSPAMALPLKWEFPGGKIEAGETAEAALEREIFEELNVTVRISDSLSPVEYAYPQVTIRLIPFTCEIIAGTLRLKEHTAYRWVAAAELETLDWAAADRPIVAEILRKMKR